MGGEEIEETTFPANYPTFHMYTYSYFIANTALLLVWFLLFFFRKDVRKEMLVISTIFGLAGVLVEYVYTIDWWRPLTITGTRIGIEDFVFGFWVGGVSAVIYEEVFKKKIYKRRPQKGNVLMLAIPMALILTLLFFGSFFILGINSFYSSIIAIVPGILFIWIKRADLIPDSLMSGGLLLLIGLSWFWIPQLITPGWVQHHWFLENLSGIIILGAPLEDMVWGFLIGAYIGPLYEFWQGAKLRNYKI